ncbi:hypothetical protein CALVIDRAFT_540287 [Calocera viscosa TUFC12733]|uniref:Uncharacterized protein n=1 Tax=Calocera viscosa (strain TUFC12733) TaxID=1330018 RepID=A0A167IWR6_CALVF|nr:hypothetical protein CALVIDRAFT_540287 [Calocera viscosa TUFC12733]
MRTELVVVHILCCLTWAALCLPSTTSSRNERSVYLIRLKSATECQTETVPDHLRLIA